MPMEQSLRARADIYEPQFECMPTRELECLQSVLLASAVRRARQSPFYAYRLRNIGEIEDAILQERFRELVPLTTKEDLRTAGEAAWNPGVAGEVSLLLATSGTTGTRIMLPYTGHDLAEWRRFSARTLWANGFRPDDLAIMPVPLGLFTGGHGMFGGLQELGCRVIPLNPATTPLMKEALQGGFGGLPTVIVTLPSHMLRLLESLPAAGYDPEKSPLRRGSFGAEPWSEAARERIQRGFGISAVDSYGIGELCGPGVAAECPVREGMHIWEDLVYAEIIDPKSGEPLPDGEVGELVLTSLRREAFTLLRFRTGDATCIMSEPCACGRTHRRMARIQRRMDHTLIVTGVNIDPISIEQLLYQFEWASSEYSLAVCGELNDMLSVKVERRPRHIVPPDAEQKVAEAIRTFFPVKISVEILDEGALERMPGKPRRIQPQEMKRAA